MSHAESEAVLKRLLDFLQRGRRVRLAIAAVLVGLLVALAVRAVVGLVPRTYTLTMTGGDIVTNRHYLAKILQGEAQKQGITLVVKPRRGTLEELKAVSEGTVDLALVQGGLETTYPNVEHVATVVPELVHLLVKPGVKGMADLRGRSVNLGAKDAGVREIGLVLTRFAGYTENVDFVETNYADEALLALPEQKMPDAIVSISSVPSYLVEILVRRHHYQIVEIPFPEALALRHGWVANGQILGYMYNLNPPVPEKSIVTVAVNMQLLANARVEPAAIAKLLGVLYSPSVASRLRQELDERRIAIPSGYPFSAGLTTYLRRNDSILTLEAWNKVQSSFALVMSFAGMLIVLLRWFRGPPPETDDAELHARLLEVAALEREVSSMEAERQVDQPRLVALRQHLAQLNADLLARYPTITLKDPRLFDLVLGCIRAAQVHVGGLVTRASPPSMPGSP
jgi:TRAP-type uncharacterized transport system substrate-binding protein